MAGRSPSGRWTYLTWLPPNSGWMWQGARMKMVTAVIKPHALADVKAALEKKER